MKERRIMSKEDIEKKEKQLNTTLSDDEMSMASEPGVGWLEGGASEIYMLPA